MSLSFLETNYVADASNLNIGYGSTDNIVIRLQYNMNGLTSPTSFTVQQYDSTNTSVITTGLPYTVSVVTSDLTSALLTLTFNYPATNVLFGLKRKLTITTAGVSTDIYVTTDYSNTFNETSWTNAADVTAVHNIEPSGPLTSGSLNNILRAIYQAALTAYNKVNQLLVRYSFKDQYLQDIIDLAISAGVALDESYTNVTYNSDGTLATIVTAYYGKYRNIVRSSKLKITYTYASVDPMSSAPYTIARVIMRSGVGTPGATSSVNLLTALSIQALDSSDNRLFDVANILFTRTLKTYANPYLLDYDVTLDNLSDYKYYQTYVITGWAVTV